MSSNRTPATILLVDDDEVLRRLVRNILSQQGFLVFEAGDGAQALEFAAGYPEPLDLLLTDVIMPRVNGLALAQRMLQERSGLRVLFMSGYVEKSLIQEKHPEAVLLQKPFAPHDLLAIVRSLLSPDRGVRSGAETEGTRMPGSESDDDVPL